VTTREKIDVTMRAALVTKAATALIAPMGKLHCQLALQELREHVKTLEECVAALPKD